MPVSSRVHNPLIHPRPSLAESAGFTLISSAITDPAVETNNVRRARAIEGLVTFKAGANRDRFHHGEKKIRSKVAEQKDQKVFRLLLK